jgi:aryl-alcohol dehydrogenase-like predicted oxidoreductase
LARSDEATSHAILDRYVEAGGNFVDTADTYASGGSEEVIGRWFASHQGARDSTILATKCFFPVQRGPAWRPNGLGLSRRRIIRESAGALGVPMARLALRWLMGRPGVVAPLIGARSVEQLDQTLDATDLELPTDADAQLDRLSAPVSPDLTLYPMMAELTGHRRSMVGRPSRR